MKLIKSEACKNTSETTDLCHHMASLYSASRLCKSLQPLPFRIFTHFIIFLSPPLTPPWHSKGQHAPSEDELFGESAFVLFFSGGGRSNEVHLAWVIADITMNMQADKKGLMRVVFIRPYNSGAAERAGLLLKKVHLDWLEHSRTTF